MYCYMSFLVFLSKSIKPVLSKSAYKKHIFRSWLNSQVTVSSGLTLTTGVGSVKSIRLSDSGTMFCRSASSDLTCRTTQTLFIRTYKERNLHKSQSVSTRQQIKTGTQAGLIIHSYWTETVWVNACDSEKSDGAIFLFLCLKTTLNALYTWILLPLQQM